MNFTFWMHGDIVNMQSRLKAGLDGTNQSVVGCTGLDKNIAGAWTAFYAAGVSWCSEAANWINTGAQATQGQAIEQQLVAWQEKISGANCNLAVPIYTPTPANTTASEAIGFGLIGAAGLTSIWFFDKVSTHLLAASKASPVKRLRARSRRRVVRRRRRHA
jgi:hypothetical protein